MTRWKRHWLGFVKNWAFVGAAYAMDRGMYPSGALTYTDDWINLYTTRLYYGRDPWRHK